MWPQVAPTVANLARLYHVTEKYSKAEHLFLRSIKIFREEKPSCLELKKAYQDLMQVIFF